MDKKNLRDEIGHYSGNHRLEVSDCEEPRHDDEESKKNWIDGERKVRIKRKLRRWRNKILETTRPKSLTIHLIGQSHIDCAWMWRYEQTRKKAQVTFNKAIFHSNKFPDKFLFALSQPLLLEWIKEDNPKLFKEIQEKVNSGNLELVGGSYVEPDCMMPSGEAMIRQRLYGMRFYHENFDKLPEVEWFLDSFGYNFGLPQILAKSGAKYLWTSKMTWNRDTTFPFVNFWWEGPDGTRLLAANFHYDPQVLETWEEYEIGRHLLKSGGKKTWNYLDDYSLLKNHVQDDEICPHVGFFFGQSDGGHGPTYKEVAEANELSKLVWFQWSSVKNFFKKLERYSQLFPIWNDELYLEFHRGCFSNHGEVKRYNRKYENLLPALEKLAAFSSINFINYSYPRKMLEKLWKITLKSQFHDILPGSSIPEVYDDCWEDWRHQEHIIEDIISNLANIYEDKKDQQYNGGSKNSRDLILFNPLSWERISRVFIPIEIFGGKIKFDGDQKPPYAKLTILNNTGKEYICQPISSESEKLIDPRPAGWWTIIEIDSLNRLPAKIEIVDNSDREKIINSFETSLEASSFSLSNNTIDLSVSPETGAIEKIISNEINHNKNILRGNESNLTFGFLDNEPIQYHAWNLTPEYWNHPIELSNSKDVNIKLVNDGPIFSTIQIDRILGESPVTQKITLFNNLALIYMDYITNWQQKDIMLKVKYSPNLNAEEVIADGMYCATSSKVSPNTPCDKARFEKICHTYFDLSTPDKKWGLALLNEGKYAFDVMNGDIRLTMLRACRYPDPAPEAWVNKERELNRKYFSHKVPEYSGLGPFSCRYALLPHSGGALQSPDGSPSVIVNRKAEEYNNPIMIVPVKECKKLNNSLLYEDEFFIDISPENVFLKVFKLNDWDEEKSFILRLHEVCGNPTEVEIQFGNFLINKITSIKSVDLLERPNKKDYIWDQVRKILRFDMGKFEIISFKINL